MEFCHSFPFVTFVVLTLIETLISRKASEVSEISQVYFRAG